MSRWHTVMLGQLARIERDIVEPAEIEDDTLYVGLENIASGGDLINVRTVANGELASSKFCFTDRHVLFGKLRPYLAKVARPTFDGICSTDILPILPSEELDRDFLAHFLLQPKMVAWATARATGANLPRISPGVLQEVALPLPPLTEQRWIAEILNRVVALRKKRRVALARLDELQQAIFIDLFGDASTNPKGWPRVPLADLIVRGPQNGLYKPASAYGAGTPILRIDAFYDGVVTKLKMLKRVQLSANERDSYGLREGDIVVNRVNSMEYLGKSAIIPVLEESIVFESNMMRFSVDRSRIEPRYLVQFLQTSFVTDQIRSAAKHAVNQSSINQQDVKALRVNLPPVALQRQFLARWTSVQELKPSHRTGLDVLDALLESLQYRAFRGEL